MCFSDDAEVVVLYMYILVKLNGILISNEKLHLIVFSTFVSSNCHMNCFILSMTAYLWNVWTSRWCAWHVSVHIFALVLLLFAKSHWFLYTCSRLLYTYTVLHLRFNCLYFIHVCKSCTSPQDDLHRVYREMRALKKLHHQHICQLFQIIETDKMIYLILEVSFVMYTVWSVWLV